MGYFAVWAILSGVGNFEGFFKKMSDLAVWAILEWTILRVFLVEWAILHFFCNPSVGDSGVGDFVFFNGMGDFTVWAILHFGRFWSGRFWSWAILPPYP